LPWAGREFLVQGERRQTFADHAVAVDHAVIELHARGVAHGDRVLILSGNHIETIVLWWAAVCAGAIPVLGNSWWSPVEISGAVGDIDPRIVVADDKRAARVPPGTGHVHRVADFARPLTAQIAEPASRFEQPPADEDDPATIIFTSGTTGRPRGVVLSHRAVIANVHNLLYASRQLPHQLSDERPAQTSMLGVPFFHMSGLQSMIIALVTGARLVLPPPGPFDARATLELMQAEQLTFFAAVPTVLGRLLDCPDIASYDFSSIKSITMGGMPVPPALVSRVRASFPSAGRRVSTMYGLSESGGALTSCSGKALGERPWSSGEPLPVVELRVASPDPEGMGEIEARSPTNMSGYWRDDAEPVIDADGWLHTGDLGRLVDGHLELVGRSKDVVVRAGENVAAPHVEACLLSHPAVAEAAVLGLPHDDLGEEVAAAVVAAHGCEITAAELRAYAGERLAHFEVPTAWSIRSEPLPTNASGKILKARIRRDWAVSVASLDSG
jgi:long-chain acyl-CoA synthetase